MDLVKEEFSKEADLEMKFEDGVIKLKAGYGGKGLEGGVFANVKADYFLDKLAEAIPGEIDDKLFEMLKVAFKVM